MRERRHERSDDALRTRCERLLEAHRGIAFKVAATYCRHVEDRRDLVQEIHAQVWRAFPAYDDARPFSTWMYRIALNVAISATRAAQSALPLDRLDAEPADDVDGRRETDDGVRALYRCIARLAPLDRALLLLYLDEKSHREIADVLGLSETNVATKIGRLKRRIRDDLDPTGE
ncbi:MAG TPA: sigma-70 family RNA polymerase sigma factor [Dokdonella sp.]